MIPDRKNEYYKTDEDLLLALAEALRTEYQMIAERFPGVPTLWIPVAPDHEWWSTVFPSGSVW